jgi:hypothetical protein
MVIEKLRKIFIPADIKEKDKLDEVRTKLDFAIRRVQSPNDCLNLITRLDEEISTREGKYSEQRIFSQCLLARVFDLAETWPRILDDQILNSIVEGKKNGTSNR